MRLTKESHHNPELLPQSPLSFGIAASNLANAINPRYTIPRNISGLIELLQPSNLGVEIQPELPLDGPVPQVELDILPFMGLHMPIRSINFADPAMAKKSYEVCEQTFEMASQLDADYVVAHITTSAGVHWDNLTERTEAVKRSKDSFFDVVSRAREAGYKGHLYFENLEYPLYPGPLDEIVELLPWLEDVAAETGLETGMTLDLAHEWHSYNLIKENIWRRELSSYSRDRFVKDDDFFNKCLVKTLGAVGSQLKALHVTGVRNHQTHLLPVINTGPTESDRETMDLGQCLKEARQTVKDQAGIMPVINEAHDYPYEVMAASSLLVRSYLTQ